MRFLSVAHTDVGTTKQINQDAFCLKTARTPAANIAFAVLCDGMGGLKNGEYASALVVNAFSRWFHNEFPQIVGSTTDMNKVAARWGEIVQDLGKKILRYGQSKSISLGTTLTALLLVNNRYLCVHVGDSRLYKIGSIVQQLTKDHTFVANEVAHNRMTPEQAKTDSRKNVLLQCVGASKEIIPEFVSGVVVENEVFMLCSDGFRHEVTEEEMYGVLAPQCLTSEMVMKKSLVDIIELNKTRAEKDNITAILFKAIR